MNVQVFGPIHSRIEALLTLMNVAQECISFLASGGGYTVASPLDDVSKQRAPGPDRQTGQVGLV